MKTRRRNRFPIVVIHNLTAQGVGYAQFIGGHPVRVLNTGLKWGPHIRFGRWYAN